MDTSLDPGTAVLVLSAGDVERALTLDVALESQRRAFQELARGEAVLPAKAVLPGTHGTALGLCYTARAARTEGMVVKVVGVAPHNAERGLPTINGVVLACDAVTGRLVALLDGPAITTLRTAAASALAVSVLAREDASTLAVIGSGVQAVAHVRAIAHVRPLRAVRLWSPTAAHRRDAAQRLDAESDAAVAAVASAREAVAGAHIVVACTHSATPVVQGAWVEPGSCVVSIGSYEPDHSEVDDGLLARVAAIVVDDPAHALRFAGPIVQGLARSVITPEQITALGDILNGAAAGRRAPSDITFFNSVGIGVQDAAAAWAAVARARDLGLGQTLTL